MKVRVVFLLSAVFLVGPSFASSLPSEQRTNGEMVRLAFQPLQIKLQESSAVFYEGTRPALYGTVISSDGYILTKTSELGKIEGFTVRIGREQFEEARVVSSD